MKIVLFAVLFSGIAQLCFANGKDSIRYYQLPDSVKAISMVATINLAGQPAKKEFYAGIKSDIVQLAMESDRGKKKFIFEYPSSASVITTGQDIKPKEKGEIEWYHDWSPGQDYKLLLAVAGDSAGNFLLYSGYCWLPLQSKWKLLGTVRIDGRWNTIIQPAAYQTPDMSYSANIRDVWVQRSVGGWKNLDDQKSNAPMINLLSHVDSIIQFQREKLIIEKAISEGKTDVKENHEGVYYKIITPGTGRQVSMTDTVTINYRLTLFQDTAIIDQSRDTPATFPLNRLIKGWQIGVPLSKVGGRIKLVIPSMHAYSIRTRSPKIPPNSILEFEIEVLDTKAATR